MRVRAWRTAAGLSGSQLAEAVGVGRAAVAHWEGGRHAPRQEHLEAVARTCGVSLEKFYGPLPKKKVA